MIYTDLTKKALKLCFEAHKDQIDKSGLPYVFHPFHLAEQMTDEATTVVALLHDVVEDTPYTLDDLREMGFPQEVTDAIFLMTYDKTVPYMDYVAKIKENAFARAVKLADLQHNSDLGRLNIVTEKDKQRVMKYRIAIAILEEDRYDAYQKIYEKRIPLDDQQLCYLGVFYTQDGVQKYSVDFEYADDLHYMLPPDSAEKVRIELNPHRSLPENLSDYLQINSAFTFEELLLSLNVKYEKIFFPDYD